MAAKSKPMSSDDWMGLEFDISRERIAHFEKHLRRFSSPDGGDILIKRGGERQQTFRFRDPMMQPYVIIRGIQKGMVDEGARNLLLQKEQREFAI